MFSIPELDIVEKVMNTNFIKVNEKSKVNSAIDIMIKNNVRAVIVIDDDNKLCGIVSLTDISKIYKIVDSYKDIKVCQIMSREVISVNKVSNINECRDIMIKNKIGLLPIIEDDEVIGTLDQNHIRDHLYMKIEDYGLTVKHIIGEIKEGICAINKDGIVLLWNKFMEDRYSIKSSDIVGSPMKDFLPETISEKVLDNKVAMNDVYHSNNNEDLYGMVHANPVFLEEEFLGVVCTEVDITEAKRLGKELENANIKLEYLKNEVKKLYNGSFNKILGKSYKLEIQKEIAKKVSKTNSSILIFGESGTGKEVFARSIHEFSERIGQFIPVNCSAIPSELFESEFFGYEAGAFTGANKKGKMGIFELAKDGTVFLDELGDLPLSMQAKLLRVLQEKEVRRIGGEKLIKINPRIICATNKSLLQLVKDGKFREDLYYRLNVVEINLPPLRERKEDIEILVNNFLQELCRENSIKDIKITKEAINKLLNYSWKGNIRELKNTMETLVVLSKNNIIDIDDIPNYIIEESNKYIEDDDLDLVKVCRMAEYKVIKKAMELSKGNKAKAAKLLNIPRTTLYYKLEQNEIL